MKWMYAIAAVALFACAYAEEVLEEGDARLGYITVGSGGDTSITFNATSIQNAVILGLFLLVLGALLLPLLGVFGDDTGYGYGYESGYGGGHDSGHGSGYDAPSTGYGHFAKRSLAMMGPVLDALNTAYNKYE